MSNLIPNENLWTIPLYDVYENGKIYNIKYANIVNETTKKSSEREHLKNSHSIISR